MADVKLTINRNAVENNIKNVNYYIERLQEIFNELEREISEVRDCYKTNASKVLFERIEQFKSDFAKNINNFNSYKKDLSKLLTSTEELDILLSRKIESGMGDIKNIDPIQRRN